MMTQIAHLLGSVSYISSESSSTDCIAIESNCIHSSTITFISRVLLANIPLHYTLHSSISQDQFTSRAGYPALPEFWDSQSYRNVVPARVSCRDSALG